MSSERSLIPLNIESYDLTSPECINAIEKAKTITTITEKTQDGFILMKNMVNLLGSKMHMTVVLVSLFGYYGYPRLYINDLEIVNSYELLYEKFGN
uniref:Uncharacterized protein n=1 Tax=viral metagenome TaxID=1070528 RepID=A0A6C0CCE7_9ZZZZ